MDRGRLNIGTYYLKEYARTEAHVRDLAECGIDFVVNMANDRPTLDLFAKYGVGAVVSGIVPGWFGGDGKNTGQMSEKNPLSRYEAAAASFADHPAIWGIDAGDEPSALDFPHYGRVMARMEQLFPRQFAYLNIYPNYALVSGNSPDQTAGQLGTPDYAGYIRRYGECIPADYLCYDYYMYAAGAEGALANLRTVSDACLASGRSMWIVLQVNSRDPARWISENQLRFQAFSAMAFGAETIIWACWCAGWWHNQVLDGNGGKTEQYEKLKTVNAEIHTLAADYMRFRRTATHRIHGGECLHTGVFADVHAADGGELLVGQMVSRGGDGAHALMICAADDPMDEHPKEVKIRFRADGRFVRAIGGRGMLPITAEEDGGMSVTVSSNAGVLITAR